MIETSFKQHRFYIFWLWAQEAQVARKYKTYVSEPFES